MALTSKLQKIKKTKKNKPIVHAKPWWFAVAAIPVVLLVVVLCFQFNVIGNRRQQDAEARQMVLTTGKYVEFETLGLDVYLPSDAEEEEPIHGASYSKVRVSRFEESGNPRYAIGVIAIPNEGNIAYNINDNFLDIVDITENMVGQALADVWSGVHPNFSADLSRRKLFGNIDAIEEYGTAKIGVAYLELSGDDSTPAEERVLSYTEEPYQIKIYMDIIVVDNRPVVAWGAWDPAVSVGQANIRQSVVDALASILGVDTQDMSDEPLTQIGSTETTLIYENSTGRWIQDSTGEYVPEVPPIGDPEFSEKWAAYVAGVRGYELTPDGEMVEHDHSHNEDIQLEGGELDASEADGGTGDSGEDAGTPGE